MTPPVLGLLVGAGPTGPLASLLRVLSAWCRPHLWRPGVGPVAAWMATSPEAAEAGTSVRGRQPLAVWVDDCPALQRAQALEGPAPVLLTADPAVAANGDGVVLVPSDGVDSTRSLPLPPFLRACWRDRFGLPADLVVAVGGPGPGSLPEELGPTAMALASAVKVEAGCVTRLLEAMAWAAPCVADAATSARIGGRHGVELIIAEPEEMEQLATDLGRDWRRATELGRTARRHVECLHDLHHPASEVAIRLGLADPVTPARRMTTVLDVLGTAPDAEIRRRAVAALAFTA